MTYKHSQVPLFSLRGNPALQITIVVISITTGIPAGLTTHTMLYLSLLKMYALQNISYKSNFNNRKNIQILITIKPRQDETSVRRKLWKHGKFLWSHF